MPTGQEVLTESFELDTSLVDLIKPINVTVKERQISKTVFRVAGKFESVNFKGCYVMRAPIVNLEPETFFVYLDKLEFGLDSSKASDGTTTVKITKWRYKKPKIFFRGLSCDCNRTVNLKFKKLWPKVESDMKCRVIQEVF